MSAFVWLSPGVRAAEVTTDQSDYAPGTTAHISGSGFAAGEAVTLQVLHADGTPDTGADHEPWSVVADESGAFSTTWHVCEDDCVGSTLRLTAAGQSSGLSAEAFFTDAVFAINMVAPPLPLGGGCVGTIFLPGPPPSQRVLIRPGTPYLFSFTIVTNGVQPPCLATNPLAVNLSLGPTFGNRTIRIVRQGVSSTYTNIVIFPTGICDETPVTFTCDDGSIRETLFGSLPWRLVASLDCSTTLACPTPVPPTITCPSNLTVNTSPGACSANVNYLLPPATGTPIPSVTCTPPPGSSFPKGTTTVLCTASNSAGSASCSFNITVRDNQGPVIIATHLNLTTDPNLCTGSAIFTVSATDNCPGVTLSCSFGSVTTTQSCTTSGNSQNCSYSGSFPKGITLVTCIATDTASPPNVRSNSFLITVVDQQMPTVACPPDITVGADSTHCSVVIHYDTPQAFDNCPGVGVVTCVPASGTLFPLGTTIVSCTVTDAVGNSSQGASLGNYIDTNSVWKYLANGSDQGTAWISPAFDDSTWSSGPGKLGFGGDGERTVIGVSGSNFITFYFRHAFTVVGAANVQSLLAGYIRDDGIVVYINGVEAFRNNMPAGPITAGTLASSAIAGSLEFEFHTVLIPPSMLVEGLNVIAAEVHQSAPFSSDIGFYLELNAEVVVPPTPCFRVTVNDTTPPTFTNGCGGFIAQANDPGECFAVVSFPTPSATDNCGAASVSCSPQPGSAFEVGLTIVTCTATDPSGNSSACSFPVIVTDTEAPTIVSCPTDSSASAGANCMATIPDLRGGLEATDNCQGFVSQSPAPGTEVGIGAHEIAFTVSDAAGNSAVCTASFMVLSSAPAITSITGPIDPLPIGSLAELTVEFTDADPLQTHTCRFDWDDGSSDTVSLAAGISTATQTHTYTTAGVYTVTATVSDPCDSASATFQFVVVFDPSAGFVTGGGWIDSLAGALVSNPELTGNANFGFVSKYLTGANVPTGQTEFQFKVADFNFHSTEYQWLVVSGPKAQFKGSGTINGAGSYNFLLTATDGQLNGGGGVDKFRIKIWSAEALIYDNLLGASDDLKTADPQAISGGSIFIHK